MDAGLLANQFLDTYGLAALFGIVLLKEISVPIPIPSDLIMLGAAARAAGGKFSFAAVFFVILIPMLIGGLVQYSLARGPGRRWVYQLGNLIGLSKERLDRAMGSIRKGGAVAVGIGLTTPGLRIAVVPASGLADLPLVAFLPGLIAGSAIFLGLHLAIGYVGGIVLILLRLPVLILLVLLVAIFLLGIIGWLAIKNQRVRREEDSHNEFGTWSQAACPACLAIALMQEHHAPVEPGVALERGT